tara:strand:+ start:674 stop:865 length:192 start_codon:yes stop_codon:yes gene_type:complete
MKKVLEVITHPVTYSNLLIIGTLIMIEFIHTHAHYKMEVDVHGYCKQYEMNKPDDDIYNNEEW